VRNVTIATSHRPFLRTSRASFRQRVARYLSLPLRQSPEATTSWHSAATSGAANSARPEHPGPVDTTDRGLGRIPQVRPPKFVVSPTSHRTYLFLVRNNKTPASTINTVAMRSTHVAAGINLCPQYAHTRRFRPTLSWQTGQVFIAANLCVASHGCQRQMALPAADSRANSRSQNRQGPSRRVGTNGAWAYASRGMAPPSRSIDKCQGTWHRIGKLLRNSNFVSIKANDK
jgi:hypothetical protein